MFRLELQNFAHLLVGSHQVAFLVVESQSDEALLEDFAVSVGQFLLLLLLEHLFGLVDEGTEDAGGDFQGRVGIVSDGDVAQVAPLAETLVAAPVPSDGAFRSLRPFQDGLQVLVVGLHVVGVDIFLSLFIAEALLWQHVALEVIGHPVGYRHPQYVVPAAVECMLHDGEQVFRAFRLPPDPEQCNAVDRPSYSEGYEDEQRHDQRDAVYACALMYVE